MLALIKKVIHDGLTGIDGITYDPLKCIGYPSALLAVLVFLSGGIVSLYKTSGLDYIAFGTGFTAIMGGLLAIAAGVAVKSHTEPQP